jgi:hypothetical protein
MQENFVSLEHVLLAQKMQQETLPVLLTMGLDLNAVEESVQIIAAEALVFVVEMKFVVLVHV